MKPSSIRQRECARNDISMTLIGRTNGSPKNMQRWQNLIVSAPAQSMTAKMTKRGYWLLITGCYCQASRESLRSRRHSRHLQGLEDRRGEWRISTMLAARRKREYGLPLTFYRPENVR